MSALYSDATSGINVEYYTPDPRIQTNNSETTYIYQGWIKTASIANVPSEGSSLTGHTNYKLSSIDLDPIREMPGCTEVTLKYTLPGDTGSSWEDGIEEWDSSGTPLSVSVYNELTPTEFVDLADAAVAAQEETYIVGGVILNYVIYKDSFSATESNLVKSASGLIPGEVGTPPSSIVSSPTASHWKYLNKSIAINGTKYRITEHWEYSPVPYEA